MFFRNQLGIIKFTWNYLNVPGCASDRLRRELSRTLSDLANQNVRGCASWPTTTVFIQTRLQLTNLQHHLQLLHQLLQILIVTHYQQVQLVYQRMVELLLIIIVGVMVQ